MKQNSIYPLNLDNLYLAYLRNFLYSYMIISKFIFRVPYSIISKAVINFAIYFKYAKYKSFIYYTSNSFLNSANTRQIHSAQNKAKVAFIYLATKFTYFSNQLIIKALILLIVFEILVILLFLWLTYQMRNTMNFSKILLQNLRTNYILIF